MQISVQSRNEITDKLSASFLGHISLRTCFMTNGRLSNYFIPRIRFAGMLRVVGSNLVTNVSEQHIGCFFKFQAVQGEFFLNCYAMAITWNFATLLRFSKVPFEIYFSFSNGHINIIFVSCTSITYVYVWIFPCCSSKWRWLSLVFDGQ